MSPGVASPKRDGRHPSGARKSRFAPEDVGAAQEDQDMTFLPVAMRHVCGELAIPLDHKDPFDELLLVPAQGEVLRLPAAERHLAGHPHAVAVHEPG